MYTKHNIMKAVKSFPENYWEKVFGYLRSFYK